MKFFLFLALFTISTFACTFGQLEGYGSQCPPVPAGYYCNEKFGCDVNNLKICPVDNFCPPGSILPQTCIYGTNNKQGLGECVKVEQCGNFGVKYEQWMKDMKFYLVYVFVLSNCFLVIFVAGWTILRHKASKKKEYVEVPDDK